jgi:hypothetical protein
MMKIVINANWGGFGLSDAAIERYAELAGINLINQPDDKYSWTHWYQDQVDDEHYWSDRDIARNDPLLVQVVEELGDEADGQHACLKVVDVPDDVEWDIEEYDGREHVAERHRTWS